MLVEQLRVCFQKTLLSVSRLSFSLLGPVKHAHIYTRSSCDSPVDNKSVLETNKWRNERMSSSSFLSLCLWFFSGSAVLSAASLEDDEITATSLRHHIFQNTSQRCRNMTHICLCILAVIPAAKPPLYNRKLSKLDSKFKRHNSKDKKLSVLRYQTSQPTLNHVWLQHEHMFYKKQVEECKHCPALKECSPTPSSSFPIITSLICPQGP